jgi:predicted DNA-binding protein YlxM (UPF0122 family)
LRLEEIKEERQNIQDQIEILQFFENRLKWESMAKEKEELFKELKIGQEDEEQTEEMYAKTMFDRARGQTSEKQAKSA